MLEGVGNLELSHSIGEQSTLMSMEETTLWNKVNPTCINPFALDFVNTLERSSYVLASNLKKFGLQVHWSKRDEAAI